MKAIIRGDLDDNVIVSDFRGKKLAPVNRFILYTLPGLSDGNISVQIAGGNPGVWDEIAVGHSIFNRTSMLDVGDLCSWYSGGGHRTVGVCRPSVEDSEQVFRGRSSPSAKSLLVRNSHT